MKHNLARAVLQWPTGMGRTGDPYRSNLSAAAHQTEAIYRRYAIVDEAMLREVAERLARAGAGVLETAR
jgi:hypothetical protein